MQYAQYKQSNFIHSIPFPLRWPPLKLIQHEAIESEMEIPKKDVAHLLTLDDSIKEFTTALYAVLAHESSRSLVASPLSVHMALAILLQGAAGATAKELVTGLKLSPPYTDISNNYHNLLHAVEDNLPAILLENKLYFPLGSTINATFRTTVERDFHAAVEIIDFSNTTRAAEIINEWVTNETKNLIPGIVSASDLDPSNTALIVINTITFKGKWEKPFPKEQTKKESFYQASGNSDLIDFMHITDKFLYSQIDELDAGVLILPFAGGNTSLTILLPNRISGLPDLEKKIQENKFQSFKKDLSLQKVLVSLPKFCGTSVYSLEPQLTKVHFLFSYIGGTKINSLKFLVGNRFNFYG